MYAVGQFLHYLLVYLRTVGLVYLHTIGSEKTQIAPDVYSLNEMEYIYIP